VGVYGRGGGERGGLQGENGTYTGSGRKIPGEGWRDLGPHPTTLARDIIEGERAKSSIREDDWQKKGGRGSLCVSELLKVKLLSLLEGTGNGKEEFWEDISSKKPKGEEGEEA